MISCTALPRRPTRCVIAQQQEFLQRVVYAVVSYLIVGARLVTEGSDVVLADPGPTLHTHETESFPGMLVRHCPRPKALRPGGPFEADQRSTVFECGSAAQRDPRQRICRYPRTLGPARAWGGRAG